MLATIDLNADLGEGFGVWTLGDDAALLDVITSANVACGFHAGDPLIMRRVCAEAAARGVRIGAQVGYRDLAGFGRRAMDIASAELQADILYQLAALDGFARLAGDRVRYVKPHGALYNTAMVDDRQADAIADAVAAYSGELPVLGLPGSALARAAAERDQSRSSPRRSPTAPTPPDGRWCRDRSRARSSPIRTRSSRRRGAGERRVGAVALCVHGDTPGAVELARPVRAALADAGVDLRAFHAENDADPALRRPGRSRRGGRVAGRVARSR